MQRKHIQQIAFKELGLFFSSPIAYLFLGVFVAITLFIFFWGESFFARNIADVRPMFEWMPILLILLSSALTMRMWSEERRSGTLEHVLTLPVSPWSFIFGKFAACKTLLLIALALTLPLPVSIALIADVDWGPIISGYIATLFLGSAYLSIGLYISARSDNQIVSLIITVVVCSIIYLIGSTVFTGLVNQATADILRELGSGSRFESITRGLLDVRDFYYYISIVAVFLILNRYTLEKVRWAKNQPKPNHLRWKLFATLAISNVIIANVWLGPLNFLRLDTTEGKIYSISDATRGYINQLQEPLLIRGYFSEKTHPLLAPLVPQLKDLIQEYAIEGQGKIRVEIIDPVKNPDAEEEAGSKYGIRPNPFKIDDKYQSAVVNSYFNVLIKYGEEYKVLGFQDLIEVKNQSAQGLDVRLRNPEYDLTNSIKNVLYAYQSGGNLFDSIKTPITFTGFISDQTTLPASLADFVPVIENTLSKMQNTSNGKLTVNIEDPLANNGVLAQKIADDYGFQPMASSLFDDNTFYFYMVLSNDDVAVQIPIPDAMDAESLERSLDAGLKRFATGFTKTIGIVAPEQNPYAAQLGQAVNGSFTNVQQVLNQNMTSKSVDLTTGSVPDDVDLLMLLAPENLSEKALFAIDQFLMQGGTIIAATSPLKATFNQQSLSAEPMNSGLDNWLNHNGINIEKTFVMDSQNAPFPVPVTRQVGMFQVQEITLLDYPYFVEVRKSGLNQDNPMTSALQHITVPWASPINIDETKNTDRDIIHLINSSPATWLNSDTQISPAGSDTNAFAAKKPIGEQTLAMVVSGRFQSYFTDKPSPLLTTEETLIDESTEDENTETKGTDEAQPKEIISSTIQRSTDSARLIVISSNSFAEDNITSVFSSINGNNYLSSFELLTNAVEWSLEDSGLLSIRSRANFNRTLPPMDDSEKQFWEYVNYFLAFAGLVFVYLIRTWKQKIKLARHNAILRNGAII